MSCQMQELCSPGAYVMKRILHSFLKTPVVWALRKTHLEAKLLEDFISLLITDLSASFSR